ncbi:MAG: carboxypeptidase regulatory-like domain-containing protein [Acidobacteria bacterium]|nr:carboxypeptidase regulatory-like domain-containing protein [Acidobacteriota bacterium]
MIHNQTAAVLFALATATTLAQPERTSSIAGQVLNSNTGAPLRRAAVTILLDGRDDMRGMAPTDADGHFLLRLLPAGRYRIEVSKPGYASMNYGARFPTAPGQIITLGPNENKSGLVIRLPQLGSISGTVLAVGGAPAFGAFVQSYVRAYSGGKPVWVPARPDYADGRGRYRIHHLSPGQYIVRATQPITPGQRSIKEASPSEKPAGQLEPAPTYYPAAVAEGKAVPVELGPGGAIANVDIAIQEMMPIRLAVKAQLPAAAPTGDEPNNPGQGPPPYLIVWINPAEGASDFLQQSFALSTDRHSESRALQPGRYILSGMGRVEGRLHFARQEVNLNGGTVEITLPFTPGEELRGRIRISGPSQDPLTKFQVRLRSAENMFIRLSSARVQPDGSFVIPGVPPGFWNVSVEPMPKGAYLQSVRFGDQDALAAGTLTTSSPLESLEIVISLRGAEVRGQITEGVATVVLAAPQGERASRLGLYATSGVDENGRFEFTGLTPGAYRFYAFEELAPQAWADPAFLRNYPDSGTLVELQEGPAEEIQLKAIPGTSGRKGGR